MSKKLNKPEPKKPVEMHPASKIFLGLIGAFNDYTGIQKAVEHIKLRWRISRTIKNEKKYFEQYVEYNDWMHEFETVVRRQPNVVKLRKLP